MLLGVNNTKIIITNKSYSATIYVAFVSQIPSNVFSSVKCRTRPDFEHSTMQLMSSVCVISTLTAPIFKFSCQCLSGRYPPILSPTLAQSHHAHPSPQLLSVIQAVSLIPKTSSPPTLHLLNFLHFPSYWKREIKSILVETFLYKVIQSIHECTII